MSNIVTLSADPIISRAGSIIEQTPYATGPLSVLVNPSGQYAVEAGETFEISLTIHNQGTTGAVIDAYIDETSQQFCLWCTNPYERLALEMGHSDEVRFKVTIPVQTLPGTYNYLIVVDAPDHYPEDTPLRFPATVQVLPAVQSAINLNDTTFATQPETSSSQPIVLTPGAPAEVQVIVHNRSDRVDQFRLEIEDLAADWYQIIYPEGLGELGLMLASDHLALNPGTRGGIRLLITSPATVLAGRYMATLRLRSVNDPEVVLLDALYFQVAPTYNLSMQAEAIVRKVKRQPAVFHLHITNAGNTAREISLQAQEEQEEPLFNYKIEPEQLRIPSMTTAQATLTATPVSGRRRAWIGKGHTGHFRLVAEDQHKLPLPEAIADEALWERRPWWHLALVILMGAGALGAFIGLIWWLFFRQLPPPNVIDFKSTSPTYYQQQDDFVRLTWQIENPKRIQRIELRSEADQGAIAPEPITYDFSKGVPEELSDYCVLAQQLNCNNVFTAARSPGTYRFTLEVSQKGRRASRNRANGNRASLATAQTGNVMILSSPPPKVQQFSATQARYWEDISPTDSTETASTQTASADTNQVALNWQVTNADELSHITLVGRLGNGSILGSPQRYDLSKGLPKSLEDHCTLSDEGTLTCQTVPTNARTVGTFIFELNLFNTGSDEPITTTQTEPIEIVPVPVRIESFTINGEAAPAKYSIQLPAAQSNDQSNSQTEGNTDTNNTAQLAWRVVGGPYTKVELLPSPGSVGLSGNLAYPLSPGTQEVLTLQVTSVSGEKITRSVTIETLPPPVSLPTPAVITPGSTRPAADRPNLLSPPALRPLPEPIPVQPPQTESPASPEPLAPVLSTPMPPTPDKPPAKPPESTTPKRKMPESQQPKNKQ